MKRAETNHHIDWINTLFLSLTPVVAASGLIWRLMDGGVHWATWMMAFSLAVASGFGITAGYHRLFAHRSYEGSWPVRLLLLIFGASAFQNSAIKWCSDHRRHHRYTDRDGDPYNIQRGFWFAHMGWILRSEGPAIPLDNVPDLYRDRLVALQHRFYLLVAVFAGFVLPAMLGALWGDFWGGLLVGGFLRMVTNHHFTFAINSFCHWWGTQPYSDRSSARDSWILAIFTYGEGYHNYHHEFQADYRNGIRFYHWDPTKWLIASLAWVGLTRNLRRSNPRKVLMARLRMDEKRLLNRWNSSAALEELTEMINRSRARCEVAYARYSVLRGEYETLKVQRVAEVSLRIEELKREIRGAQEEWRMAQQVWQNLLRAHLEPLPC